MSQSTTFKAASGAGYESQMGRWARCLANPFLDFAGLPDDGHVFDAGCGTGALSAEIVRRNPYLDITGIDISPDYIGYARDREETAQVRFQTGDLTALDFPDAMFDQTLSQLVLHFIPDPGRALRELVRVTKPGGTVAACVWDSLGGLMYYRIFLDTAAMIDPDAEAFRHRTGTRPLVRDGELRAAWKAAGLADIRSADIITRTDFRSFEDYWWPMENGDGPFPGYLKSRKGDMSAKIKDAVRAAYLSGEPDGPRSFVAVARAVAGRVAE